MNNLEFPNIINDNEFRYTVPDLENKLLMMNKTELIASMRKQDKHHNKQIQCMTSINNAESKVIPSQYYHKKDVVNDTTANANRHHTSSHYVMAGGVQFQRGCRVKGVVSRHSRQAAIRNGKNK